MSRSNDPGHFFQTSSALSEEARKAEKSKNKLGDPIKLTSKLLAVTADPLDDNGIYVAEAAGNVRRIALEVSAPLTSIAVSPKTSTLFAGCWDKNIWTWPLPSSSSSSEPSSTKSAAIKGTPRFSNGHTDFVKCLLAFSLGGKDLLVSGGADACIIVWDVESGQQLYKLKGHTRGVLALAVDPASHTTRLARQAPAVTILSAGSDREIRAWRIRADRGYQIHVGSVGKEGEEQELEQAPAGTGDPVVTPLIAHDTSVDALVFDSADDLWTASADRSSKCLARSRAFAHADTSLPHPDFVRDVAVDDEGGWVATACRDENVRVWDKGAAECAHVFEGHYEEVTGLCLLPGQKLVSVSIDGTVRRWSLKRADVKKAREEAEKARKGVVDEDAEGKKESLLTEDEERELAELMDEDD
ncbi:putative WD repeat-containing protein [Lasiodiplodia theobromae]|uniref:Putative WD repeat-containing protein n=1 Tax=Lasiodiplodia theobromae TaxID=45133 RepID=A0A5N5DP03_9PEZI|nr:putative WD repeat-containing protein [Lasiodiplodia theobromae]